MSEGGRRRRRRSSSYESSESSGRKRRRLRRERQAAAGETSKWGSLEGDQPAGVTYTQNFTNGPASGAGASTAPSVYQAVPMSMSTAAQVAANTPVVLEPAKPAFEADRVASLRATLQGDTSLGKTEAKPAKSAASKPAARSENVLVNPLMGGAAAKPAAPAEPSPASTIKRILTLDIPRNRCGMLIGKEGRNHQALVAKTGCEIKIPSYDSPPEQKLVLKGEAARVEAARREIEATLQFALAVVSDETSGSRVICLSNLVASPEDVDEELINAVKGECKKFGPLTNILVYDETQPLDGSVVTKLLVQFQLNTSAQRALEKMHGRYFDRRKIHGDYFCEDAFARLRDS
eukprot:TRINITY_DN4730_c0_g2_i1.p1 TRINITY_DN4730_c0_g2~~TRINITY_DN4730_c0_g2_i1.p1  ORF type:complete len:364 (+),score=152.13 TRINITY_DN4730_c0_g2_i1:49-1092(+)